MKDKLILGISVGIIAGSIGASVLSGFTPKMEQKVYNQNKLNAIKNIITKNYIKGADEKKLVDGIYKGYMYGVEDGYTVYLNQDEFKKNKVLTEGNYIGTGIKFAWGLTNQYLIVTDVIPNSPAEEAGIMIGNRIVGIDGIKAMMSNQTEITDKLIYTGKEAVSYKLQNNDGTNEREIVLKSREVNVQSIKAQLVQNQIAYIKLQNIKKGTTKEIEQIINELKQQGARKILLDVRGLYSSNIKEIEDLCDLFLPKGKVFSVKDKNKKVTEYYSKNQVYKEPLGIVIDKQTEGIIEAFVSAIKELNRGVVVGETTRGKGTTEQLVPLEDGAGMMITTGIVYTAKDNEIKDKGVAPTITEKMPIESILETIIKGTLSLEKDNQLQRTIKELS